MARHATTGPGTSESVITRHVVRVLISVCRASTVRPLSAYTTDPVVFKPTLVHRTLGPRPFRHDTSKHLPLLKGKCTFEVVNTLWVGRYGPRVICKSKFYF